MLQHKISTMYTQGIGGSGVNFIFCMKKGRKEKNVALTYLGRMCVHFSFL